jgi:hypothetical protein
MGTFRVLASLRLGVSNSLSSTWLDIVKVKKVTEVGVIPDSGSSFSRDPDWVLGKGGCGSGLPHFGNSVIPVVPRAFIAIESRKTGVTVTD